MAPKPTNLALRKAPYFFRMADSAATFRDRAKTYEQMKRYVADERALQVLQDLADENMAKAVELDAPGTIHRFEI
jgi:hypothetical protein